MARPSRRPVRPVTRAPARRTRSAASAQAPRARREARQRRWRARLIAGTALLLAGAGIAIGVTAFVRSDRARFLLASRVLKDRTAVAGALDRVVAGAVSDLRLPARSRIPAPHGPDVALAYEVTLPPRLPLVAANLAVTREAERIRATVWDAVEVTERGGPAVRVTLGTHREPVARVTFLSAAASGAGTPVPTLALVLVDVTEASLPAAERFFRSGLAGDAAIVPGERHADRLAKRLLASGAELIVHLPMEAKGYGGQQYPGPDPILLSMNEEQIRERVQHGLRRVPGAAGIANRMGSFATQDKTVMRTVLSEVSDRGLFFLELPTTPDTVVRRVAREVGATTLASDASLDARRRGIRSIALGLDRVAALALRSGHAVATVHADSLTCTLVRNAAPSLAKQGVKIAPVSALLGP